MFNPYHSYYMNMFNGSTGSSGSSYSASPQSNSTLDNSTSTTASPSPHTNAIQQSASTPFSTSNAAFYYGATSSTSPVLPSSASSAYAYPPSMQAYSPARTNPTACFDSAAPVQHLKQSGNFYTINYLSSNQNNAYYNNYGMRLAQQPYVMPDLSTSVASSGGHVTSASTTSSSSFDASFNSSPVQTRPQDIGSPRDVLSDVMSNANAWAKKRKQCCQNESGQQLASLQTSSLSTAASDVKVQAVESKRPRVVKLAQTHRHMSQTPRCKICRTEFDSVAKCLMHTHKFHNQRKDTECPICCKSALIPIRAF